MRIKPLDWAKHPTAEMWRAYTPFGMFQVSVSAKKIPAWYFEGSLYLSPQEVTTETLEEAKAQAQQHYCNLVFSNILASDLSINQHTALLFERLQPDGGDTFAYFDGLQSKVKTLKDFMSDVAESLEVHAREFENGDLTNKQTLELLLKTAAFLRMKAG